MFLMLAAGCGTARSFARPEGGGGWSGERRQEEIRHLEDDFAAAPPAAERPAAGEAIDLGEALRLAASGNRRVAEARWQLDVARQQVFDARGRLLPSTAASGRYTWYTAPQTTSVNLPPGILPAGTQPEVRVRDDRAGVLNGTLTLPLDLSGELRHTLAAAQAGYRGEAARLWATRLEQDVEVIRSYFAVLEAQRLREVTEQTVALHREQLDNAQQRYDNGRLTKNQLLVVQVALRDSEQRLVRDDLAVDRARWTLNETLGLDIDAPTQVADVRDRPQLPDADEALRAARADNPVLTAVFEEQRRLQDSLTALRRSRLPRFSAGAAVDYSSSDILQPQDIGSGFVGFTWDLGTDTRREAQIAAAEAAAQRNRVGADRLLREIEQAVRSTQRAAQERLSALDTARAAVDQAEENLRIRQQQFDAGRATSEDVLDADALLARQRATLATALYEAHTRRAELQQLMGEPLKDLVSARR